MIDSAHNPYSQPRLSDEEGCAIARLTKIVLVLLARIPACVLEERVYTNRGSISIFCSIFEIFSSVIY